MSKEFIMEKKIKDLEENRKLQKQFIQKLQAKVDNLEKVNESLSEELDHKENIIHNLKQKYLKCSGCEKYNKSMDEVVTATAKHKEAALTLKKFCEKQKEKIKEYENHIDEFENDVTENEERIKQLEEDVEIGFDMNKRKSEELEKLSREIINYKQKEKEINDVVKILQKKKEISERIIASLQHDKDGLEIKVKEFDAKEKEQEQKSSKAVEGKQVEEMVSKEVFDVAVSDCEMKLYFYRNREKDLEEEIHAKNHEIERLEKQNATARLTASSGSLAEELNIVEVKQTVENKESKNTTKGENVKDALKNKLQFMKRKAQEQRTSLKESLHALQLKEELSKYGCTCRGFCRVTHSKHNWTKSKSEILLRELDSMETFVECETCNSEFKTFSQLEKHVTHVHTLCWTESVLGALKKCYNCNLCEKTFPKQGDFKKHKKTEHNPKREKIGEVKEDSQKGGLS
jgi:hypothetical protein